MGTHNLPQHYLFIFRAPKAMAPIFWGTKNLHFSYVFFCPRGIQVRKLTPVVEKQIPIGIRLDGRIRGLHYIASHFMVKKIHQFLSYCWWLKSCTTWDVGNPINNGKNYQPQLVIAGFQPSNRMFVLVYGKTSHHLWQKWFTLRLPVSWKL